MKPMGILQHAFAYVTLGLLCGWYYFLILLFPILLYLSFKGSYSAGFVLATLIILSFTPLQHEPWEPFMYSWLFKVWRAYFDFSYDCDSIQHGRLKVDERYMFFEFPHGGIKTMHQLLPATCVFWFESITSNCSPLQHFVENHSLDIEPEA